MIVAIVTISRRSARKRETSRRSDPEEARFIPERTESRDNSIRMTKSDRVTGSSSKSDPHESEYRASAVTKCKDIISVKGDVRILKREQRRRGSCARAQGDTGRYRYTHIIYIYNIYREREPAKHSTIRSNCRRREPRKSCSAKIRSRKFAVN